MNGRILSSIIFICSFGVLLISLKLLWNMGIFVDEYGTSPDIVCGGKFWLMMYWFRLILLAIITFVSGIKLFGNTNN